MNTTMTRPGRSVGLALALAALLVAAGCDSGSFVPPPPPSSGGPGSAVAPAPDVAARPEGRRPETPSRIVELILARPSDPDRHYLALSLRQQLGKARTIFRVVPSEPGPSPSPGEQAEAIRAAARHGVAGLVVEPRDDPAVVEAIAEAAGRGVAVLLLDRPVPVRGGWAIPRVEFTGFDEVGRQVVADVLEADRLLKRPDPGRVVLLHRRSDDPYGDRALQSMLGPCRASVRPTEVLDFQGALHDAEAVLRKTAAADPRIDIVLADDAAGIAAAYGLQAEWSRAGGRTLLFGGYLSYDARTPQVFESAKAFADRSLVAYSASTARAILDRLDGKTVAEVVEVPIQFHRRPWLYVPRADGSDTPRKAGQP